MGKQLRADGQQRQGTSFETIHTQELEKLEQSFVKVRNYKDPLQREQALIKESRELNVSLDEYRRLYTLSRKKSHILTRLLNAVWKCTGIGDKKLWDFAQLLAVPLFIAGATIFVQNEVKKSEIETAKYRADQEILNSYLDVMTKQIAEIEKILDLRQKTEFVEVSKLPVIRATAKSRTLTALRTLTSERNNELLGFLRESNLIGKESVRLSKINFEIDFKKANLRNADLKGVDLSDVNLSGAILAKANLTGAKLIRADLSGADLTDTKLDHALLVEANLTGANFGNTIPALASFCGAKMPKDKESRQGCDGYVVAGTGLLVRNSPADAVIGGLDDGASVVLTGKTAYHFGRNWFQLTKGGWVVADYVAIKPPTNNTSNVFSLLGSRQ